MHTFSSIVAIAIVQISLNHQQQKHAQTGIIASSGYLAPSKAVNSWSPFLIVSGPFVWPRIISPWMTQFSGFSMWQWKSKVVSKLSSSILQSIFRNETLRKHEMMTGGCWLTNLLTIHNKYEQYEVGLLDLLDSLQVHDNMIPTNWLPSCIWSGLSHIMRRSCVCVPVFTSIWFNDIDLALYLQHTYHLCM